MNVEFDIASDQIDGARDYQEDAFMVSQLGENDEGESCSLVIMADGMGGHAAGNVASNMVVATFNKAFQSDFPSKDVPESLSSALNRANQQIKDSIKETPALRGMGCTMVTAYLENNNLYWVSVGDSHLYLIRDRELIKQNADHSYGAYIDMMREQGMDIEEQPGMSRNMLMSAMTGEEISSIDCPPHPVKLKEGDRLIISSDGLDTLGAGAIIQYSSWSATARECVYALLKAVEEANKINQDNTTIIVVDIKEKAKPQEAAAADSKESLSRSSPDIDTSYNYEPPKEKRSYAGLIKFILILLIAGAGYYVWQQGMLDSLIGQVTTEIEKQMAPEPATPAPVESPPSVATPEVKKPRRELVKQPELQQPEALVQEQYVDHPDPFTDRLKIGGRGPKMIALPAGSFLMGNASGLISPDENPRHKVQVPAFAMSIYEVTYAEYDVFARATRKQRPDSSGWDRKTHPVNNVSWDNALAYAAWLSKQTGKKYRLPSEAEWEYAARAGTRSTYWWGSDKGKGNAHCFNCDSELNTSKPAKVGSYKPNAFGLYDTAGNLYEWVHDCYHRNYNGAPEDGSVWEGGDCSVRVVRGGAYRSPASSMRVENREVFPSNKGQYNVGIRLVREL
jgi:formylglycine-generating enzyme required for sulfatase activity/serine/threonine protein phosphatase PrpC